MRRPTVMALIIGVLLASVAGAQATRPSELKFAPLLYEPPNPNAFRTVYGSGLRAYVQEDHSLPLVSVSALINFGDVYVAKEKAGLGGLLGRTLIKGGTASRDGEAIEERIDFLGGTLSFSVGERTSTLSLSVLSKDLDEGLALFFDVLRNPAFRPGPVDLARARLIEDLRQANDQPRDVLSREFEKLIYGDHPLTWRPTKATYTAVTAADLAAAHRTYFAPSNIILAAAGDFSKPALKAKVEAAIAGWAKGAPRTPVLATKFAAPEPGVYFAQRPINQGYISLGHLGIEESNPDFYAVQVMNFILGGGSFTSRITTKVRSDEGLSYNQGSRFATRWGFPGTFSGYVQTKCSTVGYAISLIQDEIKRIRETEVADAELATAVNYYLESFSSVFDSPQLTMATFAEMEMTGKPRDYYARYRDHIRAVNKARVREVAQKYIRPEQMAIVIVGDFEPSNAGSEKWQGPLERLGTVRRLVLTDPMTGEPLP